MHRSLISIAIAAAVLPGVVGAAEEETAKAPDQGKKTSGNPIFPGWYADPEGVVFGKKYWVYPTFSSLYENQTFFDAFSSSDLVTWQKHEKVLDVKDVKWAKLALWAPAIVENKGRYYLFFSANDIQNNDQLGGLGVAVADKPEGPFKDLLGKPLVDRFHHGAQPIDGYVFRDKDGTFYLIYGGWRHCNIAKLKDDFTGFVPFENGETFREITPKDYVEGPFMFIRDGKYYFMWSEGGWGGPDYRVAYAISDNLMGPYERIATILQSDPAIATSAGHHSVVQNGDDYFIIYHRRPAGERGRDSRETCIDKMEFDEKGHIKPVKITKEGVTAHPLR